MLFTSLEYLIFLISLVLLYYIFPNRYRTLILIIASLGFYSCWGLAYTFLLLFSTIILYFSTVFISFFDKSNWKLKKIIFIMCLSYNIFILTFFKYLEFIWQNIQIFFSQFNVILPQYTNELTLPLGISFFTFMAISYLVDIYHHDYPVERKITAILLYISFFPHLIAGPIMRAKELIPQFKIEHKFNDQLFFGGLKLIIWGFFKKIIIADRLSSYVNLVYGAPVEFSGLTILIATIFFSIQIYCDFSGYCDIAIGSAQMFGYRLPDNFNRPYFSSSINEFWRKWHITLYSWFRDYIYIPLGGSRVSKIIWYRNILIVFTISGLWHGANWTFISWGFIVGILLVVSHHINSLNHHFSNEIQSKKTGLKNFLSVLFTFTIISLTWVFFRASSINDIWIIFSKFFLALVNLQTLSWNDVFIENFSFTWFFLSAIYIFVLIFTHIMIPHENMRNILCSKNKIIQWTFCYTLIIVIILSGDYDPKNFIYFQF